MWPSLDNPGMAKLLVYPGILGQGGACVWPSLDNPGMAKLLGKFLAMSQRLWTSLLYQGKCTYSLDNSDCTYMYVVV